VGSGSGLVSTLEDGEIEIHLHVMLYDGGLSDMPAVGGHVLTNEPVPAHGTVEVAIQEVTGVKLVRRLDDEVGESVTFPEKP
jgi:predicted DNA-binding protein with PD1-like motif